MAHETAGLWNDMVPAIDAGRCRCCAECPPVGACLAKALRREGAGTVPIAEADRCFACYSCVGACPFGAIVAPRMM